MLTDATEALLTTVRNPRSTDADLNAAAQSFLNAVRRASVEDANQALRTLSGHFGLDNRSRAGFLAVVCGALVEQGCDPLAIVAPLTRQLRSLFASSADLAAACTAQMPKPAEDQEWDPAEIFEITRKQVAETMPQQNAAWDALELFWRPAIVVFSLSAEARNSARDLQGPAASIAEHHAAGHWLRLMLSVLDNEPILAIEPQTMLGIAGRISGVVDNFQLNVLLMDAFPRSGCVFSRRRVSRRVADVARGIGPQQTGDLVTGVWNMYTWKAIQPGLSLPDQPFPHASLLAILRVWLE